MYTGIIDHIGKIISIQSTINGLFLTIQCQFKGFKLGESIAIDGICVTVSGFQDGSFDCELSPETLKLTTAKHFQVGTFVNLERSLTLQDRLGGHFVMGHVDTTATVQHIENKEDFIRVTFGVLSKDAMFYLAKKGCVCVNGVSLTLNEVSLNEFEIMLIPHTQSRTNLQNLNLGDIVNIEFDPIARVVVHQLKLMNNPMVPK